MLVVFLAASATGCVHDSVRGNADLQVTVRISPTPPVVGPASIVVDLTDAAWRPRNGATVTLLARTPRSGTGSVVRRALGEGSGRYRAEAFSFTTEGPWTLTARVELPGGLWMEVDRTIDVGADQRGADGTSE